MKKLFFVVALLLSFTAFASISPQSSLYGIEQTGQPRGIIKLVAETQDEYLFTIEDIVRPRATLYLFINGVEQGPTVHNFQVKKPKDGSSISIYVSYKENGYWTLYASYYI
ncbi:hypothetical protein ACKLNQ_15935 [Myroides odoratimimus]|uniref:hypothetical protein n=1 Tax=Myroides odoratimimus TaxID=76832 RepID=UPI0038D3C771